MIKAEIKIYNGNADVKFVNESKETVGIVGIQYSGDNLDTDDWSDEEGCIKHNLSSFMEKIMDEATKVELEHGEIDQDSITAVRSSIFNLIAPTIANNFHQ
jgi:hypothetical protein